MFHFDLRHERGATAASAPPLDILSISVLVVCLLPSVCGLLRGTSVEGVASAIALSGRRRRLDGVSAVPAHEYMPDNLCLQTNPNRATYYVSTSGNDANSGTSALPFRSLHKGVSVLQAGDTLIVKPGTYTPVADMYKNLDITVSGTSTNYVVIKGEEGGTRPIIEVSSMNGVQIWNSNYVEFRGFEVRGQDPDPSPINPNDTGQNGNGISAFGNIGNSFVRIIDNHVHHVGGNGIGVANSDQVLIAGNKIWHVAHRSYAGNSGIAITGPKDLHSTSNYGTVVAENLVFDVENLYPCSCYNYQQITDGNGIIFDYYTNGDRSTYSKRMLAINNVVHSNGGRGIHAFNFHDVDVMFNTAYGNLRTNVLASAHGEYSFANAQGIRLYNNIAVSTHATYALTFFSNTNQCEAKYNVLSGQIYDNGLGSAMSNNLLNVDPLFVETNFGTNYELADFRLNQASPAIDFATSALGTYPVDFSGESRLVGVAADVGAYEYRGTSTTPIPSAPPATEAPSKAPTLSPSGHPSDSPTDSPVAPTDRPSALPSSSPSSIPTHPTEMPSDAPTNSPIDPTDMPSFSPTFHPSDAPTNSPIAPTGMPSFSPTLSPSNVPTNSPVHPTEEPTFSPSSFPSDFPSSSPVDPVEPPSVQPSTSPSERPTSSPVTPQPTPAPAGDTTTPFEYLPDAVVIQSGTGTTYYVKNDGNDAATGTTVATAFQTLKKGVSVLNAGDTLLVLDGTYNEYDGTKNLYVSKHGTASDWIVIAAYPKHFPKLQVSTNNGIEFMSSQYIEFRGFEVTGEGSWSHHGISIFQGWNGPSSFIRIVDNVIHHTGSHGIAASSTDQLLIARNEIYSCTGGSWQAGIHLSGPTDIFTTSNQYGIVIAENKVYNNVNWNGGEGIMLGWSTGTYSKQTLVTNNLLFGNGARGIFVNQFHKATILQNTLYGNTQTSSYAFYGEITVQVNSHDVNIKGNVLQSTSAAFSVMCFAGTSGTIDVNVLHGATNAADVIQEDGMMVGPSNVESDPLLVDPAGGNFRLQLGSPAVDNGGSPEIGPITVDMEGSVRPKGLGADAGSYESY